MFLLQNTVSKDVIFYLIDEKEYMVGRKNSLIELPNDTSVSRVHGKLIVRDQKVYVVDLSSKYGIFRQSTRIPSGVEILLDDQDVLRFGAYDSIFKITKLSCNVVISRANNLEKSLLKRYLSNLNGMLLNQWSPGCDYLVMSQISEVSDKLLHAIVDNKPIVTLKFWEIAVECIRKCTEWPKFEEYAPPIDHPTLNKDMLKFNEKRGSLFCGKCFVFPTKNSASLLISLIEKTGGKIVNLEQDTIHLSQSSTTTEPYIFVTSDPKREGETAFSTYIPILSRNSERIIATQEIVLAILNCDSTRNTNPKFKIRDVFRGITVNVGEVLVPESLGCDGMSDIDVSKTQTTSKRKLDTAKNIFIEAKKTKLDPITPTVIGKRKTFNETSTTTNENNEGNMFMKLVNSTTKQISATDQLESSENPFLNIKRIRLDSDCANTLPTSNPFSRILQVIDPINNKKSQPAKNQPILTDDNDEVDSNEVVASDEVFDINNVAENNEATNSNEIVFDKKHAKMSPATCRPSTVSEKDCMSPNVSVRNCWKSKDTSKTETPIVVPDKHVNLFKKLQGLVVTHCDEGALFRAPYVPNTVRITGAGRNYKRFVKIQPCSSRISSAALSNF